MQRLKGIITTIILTLLVITLAGCGVTFPKTAESLIEDNRNTLASSQSTTIIDSYKFKDTTMRIPIVATSGDTVIDEPVTLTILSGLLSSTRVINDEGITATITFENFVIETDKLLKQLLLDSGINIDKLNNVSGSIVISITPAKMTIDTLINNLNQVSDKLPAISKDFVKIDDKDYKDNYAGLSLSSKSSIFGNIEVGGKLDKESLSYQYSIPKESVHDQLLRMPKLLIDTLGGMSIVGDDSIHSVLLELFNLTDIIKIADRYFTPDPVKVVCRLTKSSKGYYVTKMTGNYFSNGKIDKDLSNVILKKILALLPPSTGGQLFDKIEVSAAIQVRASVALSSTIKIGK